MIITTNINNTFSPITIFVKLYNCSITSATGNDLVVCLGNYYSTFPDEADVTKTTNFMSSDEGIKRNIVTI
jgi:hypothetical protein